MTPGRRFPLASGARRYRDGGVGFARYPPDTMDVHERIVYRAFGVPDVLDEENQLKAASAALLRAAKTQTNDQSALPWQCVAQAYVEAGVRMLREHQLDAVIGGFVLPSPQDSGMSAAVAQLVSSAHDRVVELAGSQVPAPDARALAASLVGVVVAWIQKHPDAVRELGG